MSTGAATDRSVDLLFIVGCPRSGTTWLQLLVSSHPGVATLKESHLFDHFLGPPLRNWDSLAQDPRGIGLERILSREEFVTFQRGFAEEVIDRIRDRDTELVVDKTPDHALWIEHLLAIFPNALVLHMVRDPRDVTASLLAASAGWGSHWAPRTAYDAAWRWCDHVRGARQARQLTADYRELRYEDLHAAPREELEALFHWLSLDSPPGLVDRAVKDTTIDRMRSGQTKASWDLEGEPEGFVRKGGVGNWREELSRLQAAVVEYICRDLMELYGYETKRDRKVPPIGLYVPWLRDQLRRRL